MSGDFGPLRCSERFSYTILRLMRLSASPASQELTGCAAGDAPRLFCNLARGGQGEVRIAQSARASVVRRRRPQPPAHHPRPSCATCPRWPAPLLLCCRGSSTAERSQLQPTTTPVRGKLLLKGGLRVKLGRQRHSLGGTCTPVLPSHLPCCSLSLASDSSWSASVCMRLSGVTAVNPACAAVVCCCRRSPTCPPPNRAGSRRRSPALCHIGHGDGCWKNKIARGVAAVVRHVGAVAARKGATLGGSAGSAAAGSFLVQAGSRLPALPLAQPPLLQPANSPPLPPIIQPPTPTSSDPSTFIHPCTHHTHAYVTSNHPDLGFRQNQHRDRPETTHTCIAGGGKMSDRQLLVP